jgi:hypothetical protein
MGVSEHFLTPLYLVYLLFVYLEIRRSSRRGIRTRRERALRY